MTLYDTVHILNDIKIACKKSPAARSVVPSAHGINAVVVYIRGALASLEFYINIDITYVYK